MNLNFLPNRSEVFRKRKFLSEKLDKNADSMWEGFFILDFKPYSKKNKTELLVSSINNSFPIDLLNWGDKEYCSFEIKIIDNVGETNGKEFIEWIESFYDYKNKYYRFNIYDLDAKDLDLYVINKKMEKLVKFNLTSTVIKSPIFFESKKSDYYNPQIILTLCTKQSVVVNKIQF
jgi:hypothetical protein